MNTRLADRLRPCRPVLHPRHHGHTLGARLLLRIGATLAALCVVLTLGVFLAQRVCLLGDLDDRVTDAAEHGLAVASLRPERAGDLGFLAEPGQPAGLLAARLDENGGIIAAAVVSRGTTPRPLTAGQRDALRGIRPDGSPHTRTLPGLGTYRVTTLDASGVRVLTGLPMDDVQGMIEDLAVADALVAAAGFAVAGCVCALVVRRQLRPLDRIAATAVEVTDGELTGLTRVPETDPGSEVGRVGAAFNRVIDQAEASHTARRHTEERMRRFLADVSHELRTPLASIAGYAELMNRVTDGTEPALAWRRVSAESTRMTGLVEDLLLLARLDEGRPLHSAEVDLAALVAEAVWDARAAGGGHDWRLELHLDTAPLVSGDQARLHQMVTNLLANARVHTPAGTTVTATVEARDPRRVVLRIRDDGPGIPPDLLPTVFDRFTRADTSRTRSGPHDGGSGLGLAVVSAIVSAHGGRIGVRSEPGRTEFAIELPSTGGVGRGTPGGELTGTDAGPSTAMDGGQPTSAIAGQSKSAPVQVSVACSMTRRSSARSRGERP